MPSLKRGSLQHQADHKHRVSSTDEGPGKRDDLGGDNESLVVVPWQRLSEHVLESVISEFVTREGTDYGHVEIPLAQKIIEVKRQLERGLVLVLFDARCESVNLVTADEWRKR